MDFDPQIKLLYYVPIHLPQADRMSIKSKSVANPGVEDFMIITQKLHDLMKLGKVVLHID